MSYGAEEDRKTGRIAIGIGLAVAVVAAAGWWWTKRGDEAPAGPVVTEPTPVAGVDLTEPQDPTAIQYPIEPVAETPPAVDAPPRDPDVAAQDALGQALGAGIADWLMTEQLARRMVATIDNLPRVTQMEQIRAVRPPTEPFIVERETLDATVGEERIVLSEANFARYDAPVAMLEAVDPASAAQTYRGIYPELQAAYEDLGYPGRYFNDRLVAVIDHLLATPEPQGPLLLERPKVMYRFADEQLEALSPGQKLLLRIGPEHARTVKQKLRAFREEIVKTTQQ